MVGFDVVGELAPSGIFRDVQLLATDTELGGATGLDHLLGPATAASNAAIVAQQPKWQDVDVIEELTEAEQKAEYAGAFVDAEDLDSRCGPGGWLALDRFLHTQPNGKKRLIDNGKSRGHNAGTFAHETIWCISADWPALADRLFYRTLDDVVARGGGDLRSDWPDWAVLNMGVEDM